MMTKASSHPNLTSETFRDKSRSNTTTVAKEQSIAVAFRDDSTKFLSGWEAMNMVICYAKKKGAQDLLNEQI